MVLDRRDDDFETVLRLRRIQIQDALLFRIEELNPSCLFKDQRNVSSHTFAIVEEKNASTAVFPSHVALKDPVTGDQAIRTMVGTEPVNRRENFERVLRLSPVTAVHAFVEDVVPGRLAGINHFGELDFGEIGCLAVAEAGESG